MEQTMPLMVLAIAFAVGALLFIVFVIAILRWRRATIGGPTPLALSAVRSSPQGVSLPSNIESEARMLLEHGQKIEAIKLVREHTQLGLKEAKEYVEALATGASFSYTLPPVETDQAFDLAAVQVEVRALLARDQKIKAIKLVREHTHWGLKEAKEYVEALATGAPSYVPSATPVANQIAGPSLDMEAEARSLLAQGKKIEAIKLVRQHTGWGLKEAKDYVDRLA